MLAFSFWQVTAVDPLSLDMSPIPLITILIIVFLTLFFGYKTNEASRDANAFAHLLNT